MTNEPIASEKIFIPKSEEANYLAEHKLTVNELSSGATVFAASRDAKDSVDVSINISFPSGSWYDPPNRSGLHHLTEHLFNYKMEETAHKLDVYLNAQTTFLDLMEIMSGPANPKYKNYGVWPLLPALYQALKNPLAQYTDAKTLLSREKEVVKGEIVEDAADHHWHVNRQLAKLVFAEHNPLTNYPAGTIADVKAATIADVEKLIAEAFVGTGMIISVFGKGENSEYQAIVSQLGDLFDHYPKGDKTHALFPWELLETQSASHILGETYVKETELKNNLVSIVFLWPVQSPVFSLEQFSLSTLSQEISERIFLVSRKLGWGYSAGAFMRGSLATQTKVFAIRVDIPKTTPSELETLTTKIKEELKAVFHFTKPEVDQLITTEQLRQKALPLKISTRLEWMILGLQRFGKLINADQIIKSYAQITPTHYQFWIDHFATTTPTVLIVGDLA